MIQISKPDFPIGKLLATPAALEALKEANVDIIDLVKRHIAKVWGDLSDEDKRLNDEALHDGSRILSAYIFPTEMKIWSSPKRPMTKANVQRRLCCCRTSIDYDDSLLQLALRIWRSVRSDGTRRSM